MALYKTLNDEDRWIPDDPRKIRRRLLPKWSIHSEGKMTEAHDDLYLDAGKIIVFSSGSYSDYGYHGMYVTLQPLLRSRLIDLADETTAEHKRLDAERDVAIEKWTKASGDPYPAMPDIHELWETTLIKAGLLMIVDYREMHVGDYRELSIVT